MNMEPTGPFVATNKKIARYYWYGIAGLAVLFAVLRCIRRLRSYCGARLHRRDPSTTPSRPRQDNAVSQTYATLTATLREISYPQPLHFSGPFKKHLTPPPLGRILVVLIYWAVILAALWKDAILTPESPLYAYYWEKVAYRAAWVSVTQLPLIYCLSCKHNVISWVTGISYERLNWMHRWTAITMFFTVIVHWSFFYREWVLGNIVDIEFKMMSMVRYGFGAWAVIGWMVLTSFGIFRQLAYEFFVVQHVLAAFILLWLVHTHVPSYAAYNVWMAVAFVVLDRVLRLILLVWRNTKPLGLGYDATVEMLPGRAVQMTIKNVSFKWKAGQHIYIYMPSFGYFENHPFTISNDCEDGQPTGTRDIKLAIKACAGFSHRLHKKCLDLQSLMESTNVRVFISGPWGNPPNLMPFDTVVLIASGTGAAFTTPLLESLSSLPGFVGRVEFNWIISTMSELSWFEPQLISVLRKSGLCTADIRINVFVSQSSTCHISPNDQSQANTDEKQAALENINSFTSSAISTRSSSPMTHLPQREDLQIYAESSTALLQDTQPGIRITGGKRRTPDEMIRPALERARGETAVVVCGSSRLVAEVRTFVSYVSDERAVHKGTGAQGIYLFTERFDW